MVINGRKSCVGTYPKCVLLPVLLVSFGDSEAERGVRWADAERRWYANSDAKVIAGASFVSYLKQFGVSKKVANNTKFDLKKIRSRAENSRCSKLYKDPALDLRVFTVAYRFTKQEKYLRLLVLTMYNLSTFQRK